MEISRENYIIVKDAFRQELKSRAKEIKNAKEWRKISQDLNLEECQKAWKVFKEKGKGFKGNLCQIKYDYRYLHVAYSLFKGRTYEQVESKVREGNEINLSRVNKIMNDYIEKYSIKEESTSNA
jgi:hypothetical protein